MADIRAFLRLPLRPGPSGALSDVVAPPYDVIDPPLQERLYAKSPYNVIRLILNKEKPADTEVRNRYSRARQHLRDWINEGVIGQDTARALYACEQEFTIEGCSTGEEGFSCAFG